MCQQFRRTETARDHGLGILCTADVARLNVIRIICVILRIFTAIRTFVGIHNMAADMKFRRRIDQLVMCFFADFLHFRAALLADRMLLPILNFFDRKLAHPVIMGTLFLAFVLRISR